MSVQPPAAVPPDSGPDGRRLIGLMCLAQLLTMLSLSVYAAQLYVLRDLWGISNTTAGWLGAAYFVGYTLAVPVLTSLTDRVDSRHVYLVGALALAIGSIGFGLFAEGPISAALFHAIMGIGLAGTYMPGLKGLTDHIDAESQSRATSLYTASFGLGAALSYPISAGIGAEFGWGSAFVLVGLSALVAGVLVFVKLPGSDPERLKRHTSRLLDFRPVFRNRAAMAYSLAYGLHCWELFGLRTWVVAFLVAAEVQHGTVSAIAGPAAVAAALTIIGVPASIFGNELAMRYGRSLVISLVAVCSAAICMVIGFTGGISYWLAAGLCLVHGVTVITDSAALTAGALGNAHEGQRGATMAVHSTLGFAGGIFGPLAFGIVLDAAGGPSDLGWGLAYAHMGLIMLLVPVILWAMRPPPIPGDSTPRL